MQLSVRQPIVALACTPVQPAKRRSHVAHSCAKKAAAALVTPHELAIVLSDVEREHFREVRGGEAEELNAGAPSDFFELLQLSTDATPEKVRASYRALQRFCHPDIAGDVAHELAVLLNAAYATLSVEASRKAYAQQVKAFRKDGHAYDGRPVSRWAGPEAEQRAVFVDETSCIGCTHCTACAPNTFAMEDEYGRARVHTQWGDSEDDIREAIDMCPVDCISYVKRQQLALLEFVLKSCAREDTALMARRRSGNMGSKPGRSDPFNRAEQWLRQRRDARLPEDLSPSANGMLTEETAAAMARAWLKVPAQVRQQGWPSFGDGAAPPRPERVAFFSR